MLEYFKTNKKLREELKAKTEEAKGYKQSTLSLLASSTAENVIHKILKRKLQWFDYTKLPQDEQMTYFNEANTILKSLVFQNEISAYTLDLIEEIAKKSQNFDQVLTLRAKICMGELFRERLEKISKPEQKPVEPKEPHSTL